MSKRFYVILTIVCVMLSAGAVFAYRSYVSSSDTSVNLPLKELVPFVPSFQQNKNVVPVVTETVSSSTLSLLAVGDIMLDRSVMLKTQASGDYNHPFILIDPLFKKYDLHLANLEGPITTNKSIANGTGGARFTFTFSPKFVEPLKNRFEFLSLANNHEENFGQKGITQTRNYLGGAGVHYFGDPNNWVGFVSVTSSYNGITLGFVGYHQLVETGFENVTDEIKRIRSEVDILIAMPHWGIEYVTSTPSYLQKKEAHEMIDSGVDIIIGAHPHVVQPIEIYKGKTIFYSLGNFVFDQYFSEETQTGLAVGMNMKKENGSMKIQYELIPLDINGQSQVSVAKDQKIKNVLEFLSKVSLIPENLKQEVKSGFIYGSY